MAGRRFAGLASRSAVAPKTVRERRSVVPRGSSKLQVAISGTFVGEVEQAEHLPAGGAEVGVMAARVSELRDSGRAKPLVVARKIIRSELDPWPSEGAGVIHRVSWVQGSEIGELHAEAAAVLE